MTVRSDEKWYAEFWRQSKKLERQPALFNFKPTNKLRRTGFTPEEERLLLIFCLGDEYPRSITIPRTGTNYTLHNEVGAARLHKAIRPTGTKTIFGSEVYKRL